MIKVLHVNSYAKAGGAEQVATDLLKNPYVESWLIVKEHASDNAKIIAFQKDFLSTVFSFLDKVVRKLGFRNTFKTLFSLSEEFNGTYRKLKKLKIYQEADIIHLHNIHGNYFNLSTLKRIAQDKHIVWTLHDMWPVTGGEFYTYNNLNYQKGIGKTPVAYLHPLQDPIIDRRQHYLEKKKKIYAAIAPKITFIPVSNWLLQVFKGSFVYNKELKVSTIYNGIDTSIFINKKTRNWSIPRILFFNSTGEAKAAYLFTNILNCIKPLFDLYVVGQPVSHPSVKYHTSFLNDREELRDLYNKVDILVFPSKAETFGLIPLEAMACGVCVITSNATALPEIVNSKVGYVFASENSADLFTKVNQALENLEETRKLGLHAEHFSSSAFTLSQTHLNYYNLYQNLLEQQ